VFGAIAAAGLPPSTAAAVDTIGTVTEAGQRLAQMLDATNVEGLWLAGYPIDWRTGQPTGPVQTTPGGHTHCSAFAAAVAARLGIYLLRPPQHGQMFLASAQERWLNGHAASHPSAPEAGWVRIGALADPGSSIQAVAEANLGHLVVASYFQPPQGKQQRPGHIAIVRPSEKPSTLFATEGPDVIQAGGHNHRLVPLREGFASHRDGWRLGSIEYFSNRPKI
jgi:hypothetical protein